jgi:hypothetical protein
MAQETRPMESNPRNRLLRGAATFVRLDMIGGIIVTVLLLTYLTFRSS